MHAEFDAMHVDLFDAFGNDGVVTRATLDVPVRVIIDEGVARIGEYGQTVGRVVVVSFHTDQWRPQRGDSLTVVDEFATVLWTKQVESIDADDGYVVRAVMYG